MKKIIIKIFLLSFICSFSGALWAKTQHIILTASQDTGSYIFANELTRLLSSSRKTNELELVIRADVSAENRLTQLSNNRVSLAIIDAKTTHEQLKKHSGLQVLSVLWKNWLYILGTVPGPFLSLESTQSLLVHDNSLYFAQVWRKMAPQSKITWFNGSSIPDFTDGFSEEVLAVTAPVPLREISNWLEQFAGIRLLALDQQLIRSLRLNFPWLMPHKLPVNSLSYQAEALTGIVWNPVLVVRGDFPDKLATTLLNLMFSQKETLNPQFLFKNIDGTDNIAFQKVYPYHAAAKKMFRFK